MQVLIGNSQLIVDFPIHVAPEGINGYNCGSSPDHQLGHRPYNILQPRLYISVIIGKTPPSSGFLSEPWSKTAIER